MISFYQIINDTIVFRRRKTVQTNKIRSCSILKPETLFKINNNNKRTCKKALKH